MSSSNSSIQSITNGEHSNIEDKFQFPTANEQKEQIKELIKNQSLKKGDNWYIISSKWFEQWKDFVGYEKETANGQNQPGPISNEPLIFSQTSNFVPRLVDNLMENINYVFLPEAAGKLLHHWYGGPEIKRKVIGKPGNEMIELNPTVVKLALFTESKEALNFIEAAFSKEETIKDIIDYAKIKFEKEMEKCRLWLGHLGSPYKTFSNLDEIDEIGKQIQKQGQQLILEAKNLLKEFPLSHKHKGYSYSSYDSYSTSRFQTSSFNQPSDPGVVGLSNLGNTCFMNSALQCLTKTPQLQDYFLKRNWKEEINSDNPLGMGGKIATVFGELMTEMWSGKSSYIIPREFKQIIGDFQPTFSGYSQQDSQELISYLLDGIHEDLNRIVKKPSTVKPEGSGDKDEELAIESWETHLKRNNSIITDKFQGLLKSTLICPDCEKVSVTFDPFMYLSLPLPIQKNRILSVTLYKEGNQGKPVHISLLTSKNGPVKDLRKQVAEFAKCKPSEVVLADIFNSKVYKFIPDSSSISQISESDKTFAYIIPNLPEDCHTEPYGYAFKDKEPPFISVRLQTLEKTESWNIAKYKQVQIGAPFTIKWNAGMTNKQLYDECLLNVKRYLKNDIIEKGFNLNAPEELFPAKEKKEEDPPRLFSIRYEYGYATDDYPDDLPYTDDVVEARYSSEKRNILMTIEPYILQNLVDKEAFEGIDIDESVEKLKSGLDKDKGVSLEESIHLFTSKETLGPDDQIYCSNCKKHVQATKKFDLWKLPDVLVINLKRFQFTKYHREKIDTLVKFPITDLDLTPFCESAKSDKKEYKYDLFAVSNHYGSLSSGHYTAYAKVKDKWYDFNDSQTSEISSNKVVSNSAYVLFFVNKNVSTTTEVKGKIYPSKEQLEEEERQKKEAEEKKKLREEEEKKKLREEEEKKKKEQLKQEQEENKEKKD